ncbi:MAG TPA: oxygenase MpaB family protein [Vicinamibacterales bacterium]
MIAERINAERIVLAGWGRAILMQLAHPLVAAGVADHSTFRSGRFAPIVRLYRTVRAMTALTFGTESERSAALDRIRTIHRRVHGQLREAVGPFPAGTPYSAEDPALLTWVHATLLESLPMAYTLLVGPLTLEELDEYCREAAPAARDLGASDDVPQSKAGLDAYLARMMASGTIVVGPTARELAARVLEPPFGLPGAPFVRVNRVVTTGLLPPGLRRDYGLPWGPAEQRAFARHVRLLRAAHRLTPRPLRWWPEARRALAQGRFAAGPARA